MGITTKIAITFLTLVALLTPACGDDSDGDDGGSSAACLVASDDCVDGCIVSECGQSISDCSGDPMCDSAKDTMVSCVCDAQKADDIDGVGACLTAFTDNGGFLSTAFADCAATNCADECGL